MEKLLQEIIDGTNTYKENHSEVYHEVSRGIGTKAYVIKRIDLLREQLLELKKDIINEHI